VEKIDFIGPSYERKIRKADPQRSINLFVRKVESGQGKNKHFLDSIPGLYQFSPPPGDPGDLELTKSQLVATATVGDDQTYTIVMTNNGDVEMDGAELVDDLPNEFDFASCAIAYAGGAAGPASATSGELLSGVEITTWPIGGTVTVTIEGDFIDSGTVVNTATVSRGTVTATDSVTTEVARAFCGLLCHFESLDEDGKVVSARGPNLTLTNGAELASDEFQFGASSGMVPSVGVGGTPSFSTDAEITCGLLTGKSWRVEGWFATNSEYFTVLQSFGAFHVTLTYEPTFGAFGYNVTNNTESGGGAFLGTSGQRPNPAVFTHVGMQYDVTTGVLSAFTNGATAGPIFGASTTMWSGVTFDVVRVLQGVSGRCDEFKFEVDPEELYGATYTVPTSPFLPADA
jgi:uncharacterized repeat protein (TIGR01451 family)